EHRVGPLDAGVPGVDLERQPVFGAQLDQSPHDEVLEVLDLGGSQLTPRLAERLERSLPGNVGEVEAALVRERRLQTYRPLLLRDHEQLVEDGEVQVQRVHREALSFRELI